MIRNLKVLGMALVAVFAMGALAASAASAQNGKITSLTTGEDFTLTGTPEGAKGSGTNIFKFKEGEVNGIECHETHYHGEATGGGPLKNGAETATVIPTYKGCTFGGLPLTVTMNGCDFDLHLTKTTGVADTYEVTSDLTCPPEKVVEVHIYLSKQAHEKDEAFCTLTFGAQNGLKGATLKDETNGHLTLGGTIKGISSTKHGACAAGGTENSTTGTLGLGVTLEGKNEKTGAKTNLTISHE